MPNTRDIALIGVPVQSGAGRRGCEMGPAALRTAGLAEALQAEGHRVRDRGDLDPGSFAGITVDGKARHAGEMAAWTRAIDRAGFGILKAGEVPIFMGGDHSLAMGSVNAVARWARQQGRGITILWLDAHADFNTPHTSPSGNVHGMPVAALCGMPGLDFIYEGIERAQVESRQFHLIGIRSVDTIERDALLTKGVNVVDMRMIDEHGVARLMRRLLDGVAERGDLLHVSLDVDFLDPAIGPGVGTCVPGGATYREAHLIMEMLSDCGQVSSIDLAELNPFLDERGKTASLLVDLVSSLFGRKIIDRVA